MYTYLPNSIRKANQKSYQKRFWVSSRKSNLPNSYTF